MSTLAWIIVSGLMMSAIALTGSLALLLPENTFDRLVLPLVALAAGSLLGGALFHMLRESVAALGNELTLYGWLALGVVTFFVLEQYLHWHHCHRPVSGHGHVGYLILLADGLHNFIGGLAVSSVVSRSAAPSSSTSGWVSSPGSWPRRTRCRKSSATSASSCTAGGADGTR